MDEKVASKKTVSKAGRPWITQKTPELYPAKASNDGRFHCLCCEKSYNAKTELDKHVSFTHQRFECAVCSRIFPRRNTYQRHRDLVHNDGKGKIPCPHCSMRFYLRFYLQDHIRDMHPETFREVKDIPCPHCEVKLKSQILLFQHLKQNHDGAVSDCPMCDKCFIEEKSLQYHILTWHSTEAKSLLRQCPYCNNDFVTEISLFYHIDSKHEKETADLEKPFACSILHCPKRFRHEISATKHSSHHERYVDNCKNGSNQKRMKKTKPINASQLTEDERESQCPTCGKLVKTSEMRQHEKDHVGYECSKCGKIFESENIRQQHVRSVHGNFRVKCPFEDCHKMLAKRALKCHIDTVHHKKRYQCDKCEKSFSQNADLLIHVKGVHHGIKELCCVCGKEFNRASDRNRHERDVHSYDRFRQK